MAALTTSDGKTPLSAEEQAELIPSLATREELNEWERENILAARRWALSVRTIRLNDPVTFDYIRKLHRRMFDQTWKWAGEFRRTEQTIGVPVHQMMELLGALLGDVQYWLQHKTFQEDEIALRYHHRLVSIHLFPNGNGRHARLIADVLAIRCGAAEFSWGSTELVKPGQARAAYLLAMREADAGDIRSLLTFARS